MKWGTFIAILFFALCEFAPCTGNAVLININEVEGLSQRWVRCIYQDHYGFMWFGTKDGLNRYDGVEFRYYRYEQGENTLASSTINFITEDSANNLWVCTNRGVSVLNRNKNEFIQFAYLPEIAVNCMAQTNSNQMWFGTQKGLYQFNASDSSIRLFLKKEGVANTLCCDLITSLQVDLKKNLWIGTREGLCVYDTKKQEFPARQNFCMK